MNFLFWNTNKKSNINSYIESIVACKKIDTIVLAEYESDIDELCKHLGQEYYFVTPPRNGKLKIVSNYTDIEAGFQNSYCSVQIINKKYILCAIYLPSRLFTSTANRSSIIRNIIPEITYHERKLNSNNTIVVGDMNDNPYEYTCIAADTLHGLPVYEDAKRLSRVSDGVEYGIFYNPMWNHFGDSKFPPGTYYRVDSELSSSFWYMFDQVLIRPQLKEKFPLDDLEILTKTTDYILVDQNNHPDRKISDHLPIVFSVDL